MNPSEQRLGVEPEVSSIERTVAERDARGHSSAAPLDSVFASVPEPGWSERRAAGRVRAGLFGADERPLLPRYVLQRPIGRGAMGEVWSAHDPQLGREVAVKLLLPAAELDRGAVDRLGREARSLARLSHPNVVQVFDLGTYRAPGGAQGLFIVMELVVGTSLSAWLERSRPWPEVVDVFTQAARGLAAAHDVGLVHRDFKPSNVLFGSDGRVRVGDFGLARLVDLSGVDTAAPMPSLGEGELAITLGGDLTTTGAVVGTPLYMSPEQHAGGLVDARSDQYSFCVALFEAVFGCPPFRGTVHALAQAKLERAFSADPVRQATVPPALRAAILRGLAPGPRDRWPSMHALIEALAGVRRSRGGRVGLGAVVLVGVGLAAAIAMPSEQCDGHALAQRHWPRERRGQVSAALAATLDPEPSRLALADLDQWDAAFTTAAQAACTADAGRTTERWDCLTSSAIQFDAVASALVEETLDSAAVAVLTLELPDPGVCDQQRESPVQAPGERAIREELQSRLAAANVMLNIGQAQASLSLAESVVSATDDATPSTTAAQGLYGDARYAVGEAYWELLLRPQAEAEFGAAHQWAIEHRADALALRSACRLAKAIAASYREREAQIWLGHCEAAHQALAAATRRPWELALTRGIVAFHAHEYDAAALAYREVIDGCDHPQCAAAVASASFNLATLYTATGDPALALPLWREVEAQAVIRHGPESPKALHARVRAADAVVATDPASALVEFDALLGVHQRARRRSPEDEVQLLASRASALLALGRPEDGFASALQGLDVARTTADDVGLLAFGLARAAEIASARGDLLRALTFYDEAVTALPPGEREQLTNLYLSRGVVRFELERWSQGHADHQAALELAIEIHGRGHRVVALIESNRGDAFAKQGRWEDAVAHYDRAIAAQQASPNHEPGGQALLGYRLSRAEALLALGERLRAGADLTAVIEAAPVGSQQRLDAAQRLAVLSSQEGA